MSTARVFLEASDYRLVVSQTRYHVEKQDGTDAMGNKRWGGVDACNKEHPRGDVDGDDVTVPAAVFRIMCERLARLPGAP